MSYYQRDLALIHDRGYGGHADRCAPAILELLAPVHDGLVLELGCGSGALTRHLLAAGHRVVATDASADMIALARSALGGDADLRVLALPDDPLPPADAIVSVGHVLSYLPDAAAVDRALAAVTGALRPGGVLAIDILDLSFGQIRAGEPPAARAEEDWAIITAFSVPAPDRFVRDITTFVPDGAGAWRRGHERHENVLIDTALIPARLAGLGVRATIGGSFGAAELPAGLRAVTGRKDLSRTSGVRARRRRTRCWPCGRYGWCRRCGWCTRFQWCEWCARCG
jgi:SAM-dependent methyltransferase